MPETKVGSGFGATSCQQSPAVREVVHRAARPLRAAKPGAAIETAAYGSDLACPAPKLLCRTLLQKCEQAHHRC